MSRYEARLKTGSIFDHDFPEVKFACKKIDTAPLQNNPLYSGNDKKLIDALLKEYHACLADLKAHFTQYEPHVERWFNGLPQKTTRL
jgi:hypothetical protein